MYNDIYLPEGSVTTLYSSKQFFKYLVSASKTIHTPFLISYGICFPSGVRHETTSTIPFSSNIPPSDIGLIKVGISSIPPAGKINPFEGDNKFAVFAIATLSIDGLEPSRKALNILGFSLPLSACSLVNPQWSQTVSGVDF